MNRGRYIQVADRLWRTIVRTVHMYADFETGQRSAALAYYGLLSLFPLLLLAFNLLAHWLSEAIAQQTLMEVLEYISPVVPSLIAENIEYVVRARGPLNAVAVVSLIWSASGLFAALTHSLDRVWNGRSGRTFWEHRLISMILVTVILLLFVLSLLLGAGLSLLPQVVALLLPNAPPVVWQTLRVLPAVVSLGMDVFLYAMLFRFLPTRRPAWAAVWAGALVAGVGWNLAKLGFAWYLTHFARYGLVYGTLATLVAFLFWIYLSGLVLLVGAEFGAAWERVWGREEEGR